MRVFKEFSFEAAHYLPFVEDGHKCKRMHGHSYKVRIEVSGAVYPATGFVVDFASISAVAKPIIDALDHTVLNEIPGLENPTAEVLAEYIYEKVVTAIPWLSLVEVRETANAGAICEGRFS